MLEELTTYNSFGAPRQIYNLVREIASSNCTLNDLSAAMHMEPGVEFPHVEAELALLTELNLCLIEESTGFIKLSGHFAQLESGSAILQLISSSLFSRMVEEGVLCPTFFSYDIKAHHYYLLKQAIHYKFAPLRNLLIAMGVLTQYGEALFLNEGFEDFITAYEVNYFNGMTPEELLERLDREREIGELAESFVMCYELKRLGESKGTLVRQVSKVTVSAGLDIASFETQHSVEHDRLIEVKSIGHDGFRLSAYEAEVAKRYSDKYYLYLVKASKIQQPEYEPIIIRNPYEYFKDNANWRVLADGYHIVPLD